jgi:hypothetical protein
MKESVLRSSLLASASLAAIGLAFAVSSAQAADCGCRDAVRAALAHQAPVTHQMPVARKSAARMMRTADAGMAGYRYDYRSASSVDMTPYTHHWEAAPEGFVPPPPEAMNNAPMDDEAMGYGPPLPPGAPAAYGEGYGDGYAYGYRQGIEIDQGGWTGGVGRAGGGGGGGGGGALTVAQPDSLNGPSYNSFGQSYGGDYQAANKIDAWRQQALTPPSSSSK